jgi:hypothetical protein
MGEQAAVAEQGQPVGLALGSRRCSIAASAWRVHKLASLSLPPRMPTQYTSSSVASISGASCFTAVAVHTASVSAAVALARPSLAAQEFAEQQVGLGGERAKAEAARLLGERGRELEAAGVAAGVEEGAQLGELQAAVDDGGARLGVVGEGGLGGGEGGHVGAAGQRGEGARGEDGPLDDGAVGVAEQLDERAGLLEALVEAGEAAVHQRRATARRGSGWRRSCRRPSSRQSARWRSRSASTASRAASA